MNSYKKLSELSMKETNFSMVAIEMYTQALKPTRYEKGSHTCINL